jgi:hypothetical protein
MVLADEKMPVRWGNWILDIRYWVLGIGVLLCRPDIYLQEVRYHNK